MYHSQIPTENTPNSNQSPNSHESSFARWQPRNNPPPDHPDEQWDDDDDETEFETERLKDLMRYPDSGQYLDYEKIRDLMPDAVLLPCDACKKGSREKEWQSRNRESMMVPDYLATLRSAPSLAVLLGGASNGICTIDVDDDFNAVKFLKLNPIFSETLITRGSRGVNYWLRLTGEYPTLTKIKTVDGRDWGEWRADGGMTMISGVHPEGKRYRAQVACEPIQIQFEDIKWPSDVVPPTLNAAEPDDEVYEKLVKTYGEPFHWRKDRAGKLIPSELGEAFWAGLYFTDNVVVYCHEEDAFYKYDEATGLWCPVSADAIKKAISCRILECSRENPDYAAVDRLRTDRVLNAIVSQLRGIAEVRDFFAARPMAIHLQNTMLVVDGSAFRTEDFSPKFRSRNQSPIAYDSDALCNRFLNELLKPAMEPDDILVLQKYFGQCLLGENLIQRLLILQGLAERGKTQICDILQRMIGIGNVTQLRTRFLGDRFEIFKYLKKSLLVGIDVDADFLNTKGASTIKGLVGGDRFDAEQKGGTGSFPIEGKFNIVITSNCRLRVKLQSDIHAWRRRLIILKINGAAPAKKIPDFGKHLIEEEGSGILNWAIEGLRLLLKDIEETGGIRLTQALEGVVDAILAESNSVRHFLKATVKRHPGGGITVQALVTRYAEFCADRSWDPLPDAIVQRQLNDLMLVLFHVPKSNSCQYMGRAARGFHGVCFVETEGSV